MTHVLVTGATGTQGGSVVDALLSGDHGDWSIRALTRDASSDRARALADRGVEVVAGDLTDPERMADLCEGMDAVYLVTTFAEDGVDAEFEQGRVAVEAAADAGVSHLVYSSVGAADSAPLAHFESKARVEALIADRGLPATVVRPVFFAQNLRWQADEVAAGRLPLPLDPDVSLAVVDATDIGRVVARALADPERYVGETVTLAGDDLTLTEMAAAVAEAVGHEVDPVHVPVEEYRATAGDELADMFAWFNDVGYGDDPTADARGFGFEPRSFRAWLAAESPFEAAHAAA